MRGFPNLGLVHKVRTFLDAHGVHHCWLDISNGSAQGGARKAWPVKTYSRRQLAARLFSVHPAQVQFELILVYALKPSCGVRRLGWRNKEQFRPVRGNKVLRTSAMQPGM